MKKLGQWALTIFMYMLLYTGAEEALWPMIAHFRHMDWHPPAWLDIVMSSFLFPLLVAFLLAGTLRQRSPGSFPWPLLFAPLVLMAMTKYMADAFYPPFWTEFSSLLIASGAQGISACLGWFLHDSLVGRRPRTNDELPAVTA